MHDINEVEGFERAYSQIETLLKDFTILSNKNPSEVINLFKLNRVNDLLKIVNNSMSEDFRPFRDFEIFDEDSLPTNSDVLLMLNQYVDSIEEFIYENSATRGAGSSLRYWVINGEVSSRAANI